MSLWPSLGRRRHVDHVRDRSKPTVFPSLLPTPAWHAGMALEREETVMHRPCSLEHIAPTAPLFLARLGSYGSADRHVLGWFSTVLPDRRKARNRARTGRETPGALQYCMLRDDWRCCVFYCIWNGWIKAAYWGRSCTFVYYGLVRAVDEFLMVQLVHSVGSRLR